MNFLMALPSDAYREAAIVIMIIFIVFIIVIAIGIIRLQIILSKSKKRRIGFVLPLIILLISVIISLQVPFYLETFPSMQLDENEEMQIVYKSYWKKPIYHKKSLTQYRLDDNDELQVLGETRIEIIPGAIINMLMIFVLFNIYTAALIIIYFVCRKKIMLNEINLLTQTN